MAGIDCPIRRLGTEAHPAAKRGVGPIPRADRVAVLHRIKMDVIEVPREIVRVAQRMPPIPPLLNPAFASGGAAGRSPPGKACAKSRL
jgi:hypothetical protein